MPEKSSADRIVRFYLDEDLRARAQRGANNFLALFRTVLERAGFQVAYHVLSPSEVAKSATRSGYAVYLMHEPMTPNGLTIRKNYIYPFWKIERGAERWTWPVAQARFDAARVPQPEARRFARRWRNKLFGDAAHQTRRDGFVYVPLQGRLLEQRSFQSISPIGMIEHVLATDTDRRVLATLHPKETYSRQEHAALDALRAADPRLEISDAAMPALLQGCDYVVTQNSSAALNGYFFRKPAVLFARSDFHHIAANAWDLGAEQAIRSAPDLAADYDAYLWWFLQDQSINAGHPDAETRIEDSLRRAGWLD